MNEFVEEAHDASCDAFIMWMSYCKLRNGPIAELMRRSRASYKYALRYCHK